MNDTLEPLPTGKIYRSLHEFVGRDRNELTVATGEVIFVLDHSHPDWWVGQSARNIARVGFFPSNFAEEITDWTTQAVGIFDFRRSDEDEINISSGDIIYVKKADKDEEWWEGWNASNGSSGFFPSNFVQLIPNPVLTSSKSTENVTLQDDIVSQVETRYSLMEFIEKITSDIESALNLNVNSVDSITNHQVEKINKMSQQIHQLLYNTINNLDKEDEPVEEKRPADVITETEQKTELTTKENVPEEEEEKSEPIAKTSESIPDNQLNLLQEENKNLKEQIADLQSKIKSLEDQLAKSSTSRLKPTIPARPIHTNGIPNDRLARNHPGSGTTKPEIPPTFWSDNNSEAKDTPAIDHSELSKRAMQFWRQLGMQQPPTPKK